jgi:hypothetical protein
MEKVGISKLSNVLLTMPFSLDLGLNVLWNLECCEGGFFMLVASHYIYSNLASVIKFDLNESKKKF